MMFLYCSLMMAILYPLAGDSWKSFVVSPLDEDGIVIITEGYRLSSMEAKLKIAN